ncbi:MAG: hypothetical protein Hyperionvirus5_3 [Hyperionvirus sp.]|uniref:Uncharacterized protein n=1 Tax=Hyperionvirus sp. TaxID=2487770 RepID=A0A3G5A7I0_9VIRU|nr:MAG: hypothetical protein Hyperionvirus5_3 [Hyperionvirus sp.]
MQPLNFGGRLFVIFLVIFILFDFVGIIIYAGKEAVTVTVVNVATIVSALLFLCLCDNRDSTLGCLGMTIPLTLIFTAISFGIHCSDSSCFDVRTPLYVLVLVEIGALAIGIILGFLVVITNFFSNICLKEKHDWMYDEASVPYEMVMHLVDNKAVKYCPICKLSVESADKIKITTTGTKLHIDCVAQYNNILYAL